MLQKIHFFRNTTVLLQYSNGTAQYKREGLLKTPKMLCKTNTQATLNTNKTTWLWQTLIFRIERRLIARCRHCLTLTRRRTYLICRQCRMCLIFDKLCSGWITDGNQTHVSQRPNLPRNNGDSRMRVLYVKLEMWRSWNNTGTERSLCLEI